MSACQGGVSKAMPLLGISLHLLWLPNRQLRGMKRDCVKGSEENHIGHGYLAG